jgi:hypothetical protein
LIQKEDHEEVVEFSAANKSYSNIEQCSENYIDVSLSGGYSRFRADQISDENSSSKTVIK